MKTTSNQASFTTRFAPSPTGRLHIGHAYSARFAYDLAQKSGGRFILRIEDIDETRCRPEFEQGIYEDLAWLGLSWETPVRRQSEHMDDYKKALEKLDDMGVLYRCTCTRKDIQDAGNAPHGSEGALYPGTCRPHPFPLPKGEGDAPRARRASEDNPYALRLDVEKAMRIAGSLRWFDHAKGWQEATPQMLGDVVLARKDTPASYHLCVTLDDHLQGITRVTRGEDLFHASHLHRLLQALLKLDVPEWHHHKLLLDENGKRFAKRNNAVTLQYLRENGIEPDNFI